MSTVTASELQKNFGKYQAEAQREVPNDEMRVILVAEQQGSDPAVLSEQVNATMTWALEQASNQVDEDDLGDFGGLGDLGEDDPDEDV